MEALQLITEAILKEAKDSAEKTVQEAEKLADAFVEKQKLLGVQKAKEQAQSLFRRAEDEVEIYKSRVLAEAKIRSSWNSLSKKDLWIEKVLHKARSELHKSTKSKRYETMLEKLIVDAGVLLGGRELEVILNQQDSNLNLDLDKLVDLIENKIGVKTKVTLSSEKANIIGGAIVRTVDGKLVMDNSLDDILKRREKELHKKIAEKLFS